MTTYERLEELRAFVYERLCKDREMKTRGVNDEDVAYTEPKAFIGLYPRQMMDQGSYGCSPSVLIVPLSGYARNIEERFDCGGEERRFDRYMEKRCSARAAEGRRTGSFENVSRPQDLGRTLRVQFVLSVYDPGIRETGKPLDGDGDGLRTLLTWMDELERKLLGEANIGDLYVWDESIRSGPKTEEGTLVDTRPVWTGTLSCTFGTLSYPKQNSKIQEMLEN